MLCSCSHGSCLESQKRKCPVGLFSVQKCCLSIDVVKCYRKSSVTYLKPLTQVEKCIFFLLWRNEVELLCAAKLKTLIIVLHKEKGEGCVRSGLCFMCVE